MSCYLYVHLEKAVVWVDFKREHTVWCSQQHEISSDSVRYGIMGAFFDRSDKIP